MNLPILHLCADLTLQFITPAACSWVWMKDRRASGSRPSEQVPSVTPPPGAPRHAPGPVRLRRAVCAGLLVMAAGCATRGTLGAVTPHPSRPTTQTTLFLATNRAPVVTGDLFGSARSLCTRYGRLDGSIPADRARGTLTVPDPAHPARPAVGVTQAVPYDGRESFRRHLSGAR